MRTLIVTLIYYYQPYLSLDSFLGLGIELINASAFMNYAGNYSIHGTMAAIPKKDYFGILDHFN